MLLTRNTITMIINPTTQHAWKMQLELLSSETHYITTSTIFHFLKNYFKIIKRELHFFLRPHRSVLHKKPRSILKDRFKTSSMATTMLEVHECLRITTQDDAENSAEPVSMAAFAVMDAGSPLFSARWPTLDGEENAAMKKKP